MADDLDDFLKQAALRRQQRQQQKRTTGPPAATPKKEPPRLRPEVPRLQPEIPTAEVVEYSSPYKPTVGNLATSLPAGNLSRGIRQADERMESHVKQLFQHELSQIRSSNTASASAKKRDQSSNLLETPAAAAEPQPTAKVSAVSMIKQLRDPQTLRMAIIAHEIMKRPWQ